MVADFIVNCYGTRIQNGAESLTIIGSINLDDFGPIRVGSLITFVRLNNDRQSLNCRFVSVKKSMLISPTTTILGVISNAASILS